MLFQAELWRLTDTASEAALWPPSGTGWARWNLPEVRKEAELVSHGLAVVHAGIVVHTGAVVDAGIAVTSGGDLRIAVVV